MAIKFAVLTISLLLFSVFTQAQSNQPAIDRLGITSISFDNKQYPLSWSSHPAEHYYKQEYLAKGAIVARYNTMILVDVLLGDKSLKEIVSAKIAELKQQQSANPMVNYQLFDNAAKGEYMIDFLLSANAPDGKTMSIVERNVYRYKTFTDKLGRKGILLFGVSTRGYGKNIDAFLLSLKASKNVLVNQVAKYTLPVITLLE
jgi:hypothetical protein